MKTEFTLKHIGHLTRVLLVAAFAVLAATPPDAMGAAGDLDNTFNAGVDTVPASDWVTAISVLPDGRTIIGGLLKKIGGVDHLGLARLQTPGGGVDATFTASTNVGTAVNSVVVQADGGLVFAGTFTAVNGTATPSIARLGANGVLDATFTANLGTGPNSTVDCLVVQADGKLVIGGRFTFLNGNAVNQIARLNADGTLDNTFVSPVLGGNRSGFEEVLSVAVQTDGKLVIGGDFTTVNALAKDSVARLNANGSLDPTFTPPAIVTSNFDAAVNCVAVQADGKVVVGGRFTSADAQAVEGIMRLNVNGTLDTALGGAVRPVQSLVIQADGKLVLGGGGGITRLNPNGTVDNTFNSAGLPYPLLSVAMQADGKLLAGGIFHIGGGAPRELVARLDNDPATQSLTVVDPSKVLWTRGGTSPEASQTTFELSTDGGMTWAALGGGTRVGGNTADWELTGLALPASGMIRAQARTPGGSGNGSSGLVEATANFGAAPAAAAAASTAAKTTTGAGQAYRDAAIGWQDFYNSTGKPNQAKAWYYYNWAVGLYVDYLAVNDIASANAYYHLYISYYFYYYYWDAGYYASASYYFFYCQAQGTKEYYTLLGDSAKAAQYYDLYMGYANSGYAYYTALGYK